MHDAAPSLRTERLLLRRWRLADRDPCAAMNADARVMEHFPAPLSRVESDAFVDRMERCFDNHGYGLWAVEIPGETDFIGCVGLLPVALDMSFAPAVEVGWRIARDLWGQGFASEAATAAVGFGFDAVGLTEIVAYTAERNLRSRRVMDRLGMLHDPAEDFLHPRLPQDDPLAPHGLYRTDRQLWRVGARP